MDFRPLSGPLTATYKNLMMTHEYCRSVYLVMLMDFPIEWIWDFWSKRTLVDQDKVIEGADLLRFLWKPNGQVPVWWDCEIVNAIEPFFVSKGICDMNFTKRMLYRNNGGTYIPGKKILNWFYPIMHTAFNVLDMRDMCFTLIPTFAERIWTGHLHRCVKKIEVEGLVHAYLAYIPDKSYQNYIEFNFDYIAGEQIKASPRILGMDEFEFVDYVSDIRAVKNVLWTGKSEIIGDDIFVDGERYGRKIAFHKFLQSLELDLGKYNPPDVFVILLEKDYHCPVRKRVVLYAGCAYGAPLYITWVRYWKKASKSKYYLGPMVEDTILEETLHPQEIEKKHFDLLSLLEAKASFVYHAADESLSLNGKHFLKNIPAKILKNILISLTRDGKTDFEYREFKRDFDISAGQKNSNFEIRFYRLLDKLEREKVGIRIEKKERGAFVVAADIAVDYREAE